MENEELMTLIEDSIKQGDTAQLEDLVQNLEEQRLSIGNQIVGATYVNSEGETVKIEKASEEDRMVLRVQQHEVQEKITKAEKSIELIGLLEQKKEADEKVENYMNEFGLSEDDVNLDVDQLETEIKGLDDRRVKLSIMLSDRSRDDHDELQKEYQDTNKRYGLLKLIMEREALNKKITSLSNEIGIDIDEIKEPKVPENTVHEETESAEVAQEDEEKEPVEAALEDGIDGQAQSEQPATTARHLKTTEQQAEQEAEKAIQDEIDTIQSGKKENTLDKYLIDIDDVRKDHKILNFLSKIPRLGKFAEKIIINIAYKAYAKKREEYRKPIEDAIKASAEEGKTAEVEQDSHRTPEGQKFAESLNPESGEYHMQDVQESVTQPRDTERTESTDIEINEK